MVALESEFEGFSFLLRSPRGVVDVSVEARDRVVYLAALAYMLPCMRDQRSNDEYSDEEAERRATEALRRALTTPPKPQKEMVGKVGRPRAKRKRPVNSGPKAR